MTPRYNDHAQNDHSLNNHAPSPTVHWAPSDVDTDRPNAARVYDYWLGGAHNFAVDRVFAEDVLKDVPARDFARANRAFLRRLVQYLVGEVGIRQFLDLGSGLPTVGNVHEIAQHVAPDCRVVYVDIEPVAVTHSQLVLRGNEHATAIWADLRHPRTVLDHPDTQRLIDFSQPVAVLLCAVLHFVSDENDPVGIVAAYRDSLCPGSHLAISHATADDYPADLAKAVERYQSTRTPATLRTRHQITDLFDGLTLLPPGVVFTPQWRAEDTLNADPRRSLCYGGVAIR